MYVNLTSGDGVAVEARVDDAGLDGAIAGRVPQVRRPRRQKHVVGLRQRRGLQVKVPQLTGTHL